MNEQQNFTDTLTIRCSKGLRESLEERSQRDQRTLANYVRLVLEKHIRESGEAETPKKKRPS